MGGAFSTCKWNGFAIRSIIARSSLTNNHNFVSTIQFTKWPESKPIFPRTCTTNAGSVIALMFGILTGLFVLLIVGLHFRRRDMPLNHDEEQEQLLPYITVSAPGSEDQLDPNLDTTLPLLLPPTPPKDNADGKSPADSLGYDGSNDHEPPPPYVRE
ncbi:hypothetical protein DFS33DRAFT_1274812 [Desarmillaria ectypa]|nr:hypothetical protein DFS33DRAFT_1274812 [Desarmillaria ectypa]